MGTVASIIVRKGESSDYPVLIGIDAYAMAHQERATAIAEGLAKGESLVALSEGELVGYALMANTFFGNAFLSALVVSPRHRRKGIALALLAAAKSQCTTPKLFTSANSTNTAAIALFLRAGFVPSGTVENLDPGDPELIYFAERSNNDL